LLKHEAQDERVNRLEKDVTGIKKRNLSVETDKEWKLVGFVSY
jgi:hypothetical protein